MNRFFAMTQAASSPIGIFDSGFGGLNTLRGIVRELPEYDVLYLGDSARAPYGDLAPENVYEYTRQGVDVLFQQGCPIVILACNTASSEALRRLQQEYLPVAYPDRRVLGVLIPCAEEAIAHGARRIGVLATEGTVKSGAFVRELHKLDSSVLVLQQSCPMLVPLIEAGGHEGEAMNKVLHGYLAPLLAQKIDTLILGCTHYGLIEGAIRSHSGPDIAIINESDILPKKLRSYFERHPDREVQLSKNGERRFLTTDTTSRFQELGPLFFGSPLQAELVRLL